MRKPWVILLTITLLGALLRLFILSQRGSLWFDEAFSVHFAAMDLPQLWSYLKFENNPPLYFVLLHFWMKLFGASELAVRSLSMVFGVAAIPMVYLVGIQLYSPLRLRGDTGGLRTAHNSPQPSLNLREGAGRTAGLFAAFLLAISTFQVFYATETRMYTLYLFLTLSAVLLFLQKRTWPLFVVLILLVWTHITAWLIVAALGTYLLWKYYWSKALYHKMSDRTFCDRRGFAVGVGGVVLAALPWLVQFVKTKFAGEVGQGWFFYIPPPRNFFLEIMEGFLVFGENNAFIVTLLSVVMGVLLVYAIRGKPPLTPPETTPGPSLERRGNGGEIGAFFTLLVVYSSFGGVCVSKCSAAVFYCRGAGVLFVVGDWVCKRDDTHSCEILHGVYPAPPP